MTLNKAKGNMYSFLNDYPKLGSNRGYTWNVIKGKCPHDCVFCYMKRFKQPPLHFDEKELETDLGENNFIFVGSSCDMWAKEIDFYQIGFILDHCNLYSKNKYLFQSKNPKRFIEYFSFFPDEKVLGTTLESNREYPEIYRNAPPIMDRYCYMVDIRQKSKTEIPVLDFDLMVTIEPVLDFDLNEFIKMLFVIKPSWVNIGADSKGHNLPEPEPEKIRELIEALRGFTEVKIKKNLGRILK